MVSTQAAQNLPQVGAPVASSTMHKVPTAAPYTCSAGGRQQAAGPPAHPPAAPAWRTHLGRLCAVGCQQGVGQGQVDQREGCGGNIQRTKKAVQAPARHPPGAIPQGHAPGPARPHAAHKLAECHQAEGGLTYGHQRAAGLQSSVRQRSAWLAARRPHLCPPFLAKTRPSAAG